MAALIAQGTRMTRTRPARIGGRHPVAVPQGDGRGDRSGMEWIRVRLRASAGAPQPGPVYQRVERQSFAARSTTARRTPTTGDTRQELSKPSTSRRAPTISSMTTRQLVSGATRIDGTIREHRKAGTGTRTWSSRTATPASDTSTLRCWEIMRASSSLAPLSRTTGWPAQLGRGRYARRSKRHLQPEGLWRADGRQRCLWARRLGVPRTFVQRFGKVRTHRPAEWNRDRKQHERGEHRRLRQTRRHRRLQREPARLVLLRIIRAIGREPQRQISPG